jgi:polyribonucleotide nucleotidyltransferase
MIFKSELNVGGRELSIETGKVARQADGAVVVRYGDTVVLVAAVGSREDTDRDFFPLMVEYREKAYAAGKIPGGFFKREGRPGEKEVLSARMVDRPIRPLFPEALKREIQVIASVLSSDQENDSDILALVGASVALGLSPIPFAGPVGAVRVGMLDGRFVANPTFSQLDQSSMNIVVAGTRDAILMVEGGAKEVEESVMMDALEYAHQEVQKNVDFQTEFIEQSPPQKWSIPSPVSDPELIEKIHAKYREGVLKAIKVADKEQRQESFKSFVDEATAEFEADHPETVSLIPSIITEMEKDEMRTMILKEGTRIDGRSEDEIRPITCEVGMLPRTHGSALFTRGQTQSLAVTTLGTVMDEQKIDDLEGESWKSYMLHYNFPPFSVGEVRPIRGPGRREIGHGVLAERAIAPVIPSDEVFPYTIRIVSDILESNGSSSMATCCAGSLSLMDAGVPIKCPVAGIAMGLISEGDKTVILTDILGVEDHLGDMDFKVTGTRRGITAFQLDSKIGAIPAGILSEAMDRAKEARMKVLDVMDETISMPRSELSSYAPRITIIKIPKEKIRDLIGPGGKMIRSIQEETGAEINVEDDGEVRIAATDGLAGERALEMVKKLTEEPEIGKIYEGRVVKIMEFGAFIEILPGVEGLCHISELENRRVRKVEDILSEGDNVKVKILGIDKQGRIKLSRKAAFETAAES